MTFLRFSGKQLEWNYNGVGPARFYHDSQNIGNNDNECMNGEQFKRRRHYHTERSDNPSNSLDPKVKQDTIHVDGM